MFIITESFFTIPPTLIFLFDISDKRLISLGDLKYTTLSFKTIRTVKVVRAINIKKTMMNNNKINFIITDFKNELYVTFSGTVPNLFEEEKGVVAEGFLNDKKFLVADKILAKHDENYMPPEVKKSLGE